MQNLESIFVKEFRNSVKLQGYKDIYKIPLPKSVEQWNISGTDLYAIKGITKDYYFQLNKTIVRKLPKDKVAKRRVIDKITRAFKVDESGNYVYEDYKVPTGSMVVLSDIKIGLPYADYVKTEQGYGYIDFIADQELGIQYMYVLPKSVLYKVNQTALVLSVTSMKNYAGMGYVTWNNGVIFIHIIPYNPNSKYVGSRVLKTGYSLNYKSEIEELLNFWQQTGLIPSIELSELQDGTNLVLKPTTVGYDDYSPVEQLALSDREIYGSSQVSKES